MLRDLKSRLSRGHILSRLGMRLVREAQSLCTLTVLSLSAPKSGIVAIATLNADEENATVTAVKEGVSEQTTKILFVSPDPQVAEQSVRLAANILELSVPKNITYLSLTYSSLLRAYRQASRTFSTHVLLPGRDRSGRREHTHLTHGSGPKPDTTFRGPSTAIHSITPHWVAAQLNEYKLPANTPVLQTLPRLEVMERSVGNREVFEKLGLPDSPVVLWVPTYRTITRGNTTRVSGLPLSDISSSETQSLNAKLLRDVAVENGFTFLTKIHPHDGEKEILAEHFNVIDNESLLQVAVTPYQLFGAVDAIITDYSSVYTERASLGLPYAIFAPDFDEFQNSDRGLRLPSFKEFDPESFLSSPGDYSKFLNKVKEKSDIKNWE